MSLDQPTGISREHSPTLSLRANVSQSDAILLFEKFRLFDLFFRMRKGALQRIAPAYVPFALYRVSYKARKKRRVRFFAIDQVYGTLDLFEFPCVVESSELIEPASANCMRSTLPKKDSESLLLEKVIRLVFQQGFFLLHDLDLQVDERMTEFFIPYWLGFYGKDGALHCKALDAVRRRVDGDKASKFFENWLNCTGMERNCD